MPELTAEQRMKFAEHSRRFNDMRRVHDQERAALRSKQYSEDMELCKEFEAFVQSTLPTAPTTTGEGK